MKKRITLTIEANGRYCNNSCPFMNLQADHCSLFGPVTWNHRKLTNGNYRPEACKRAEALQETAK